MTKFRAGAEPIHVLTGERADAPTLRAFDHASRMTGVGAAAALLAPVLLPVVAPMVAEEAALLTFAGRVAAQRVVLWALANPAAALAASEALLGFGLQVGEDGWGTLWDQLHSPEGRWFAIAQVLMDYMHVKSGMSGHSGEPEGRPNLRPPGTAGIESAPEPTPAPDIEGARQRVAKVRAVLQQVHDGAATTSETGAKLAKPVNDESPDAALHARSHAIPEVHQLGEAEAAGMLLEEIERNAGGLRRPALETIEPPEIERLKREFADLGGDPEMLRFNQGRRTGFKDDVNIIQIRGDINPVKGSLHPRSAMSSKAALGHERGHAAHRGTKLPPGAWNDEFRASYWAAKNLPNLSEQDRIHLILDAMERAKEAGVNFRPNAFMRKILYGY